MAPGLARSLFRAVLSEARGLDRAMRARSRDIVVPRELQRIERYVQRPLTSELREGEREGEPRFQAIASRAFRRELSDGRGEDIDLAFSVIRRLSARRAQLVRLDWEPKPAHVTLDVGQVFRHKRWGFRGVVIDWHASCPGDEQWAENYGPFVQGLAQPFYRTLVCTLDRPRPFVALAAGENLASVAPGSKDASYPVEHPLMSKIFDGGFHDGFHLISPTNYKLFPEDF
ncbi:hypothetical protein T492DRAFT_1060805 [Pavlovales sp. CCMP2436]|nr:hypothetical protein T492DRAFT_1060805 [Pavlovales sp. CCMP2436]